MKKILIITLCSFIFIPLIASAEVKQEAKAKEPTTKLEAFLAKKGKILIKDFYSLGGVTSHQESGVDITALVIYEPGQESQKIRGLKIEVKETTEIERSETVFLDLEEIESLSKGIDYMINLLAKWKDETKEYTEVAFSTKGGFNIGFYQTGNTQGAFASIGEIGPIVCKFSSVEDLNKIKTMADKGLQLLNQK